MRDLYLPEHGNDRIGAVAPRDTEPFRGGGLDSVMMEHVAPSRFLSAIRLRRPRHMRGSRCGVGFRDVEAHLCFGGSTETFWRRRIGGGGGG